MTRNPVWRVSERLLFSGRDRRFESHFFQRRVYLSPEFAFSRPIRARVAGRDPGTNIVALQLESPIEFDRPEPADPALGALVLTFAADARGTPLVRLGIVRSLGPAWHSRGGGRIDRRITLDLHLSGGEEGGPVVDAAGALLGMSTAGPRGRALVIPASTVDRILPPLIQTGRVARGWLGQHFIR